MTTTFCHLHTHSEYSILDASCPIDALAARAAAFGQPALALTDHGVMTGAIEFFQACQRHDIQPIVGCEVYLVDDHERPEAGQERHHLTLLAAGPVGYRRLCGLSTAGFLEGPARSTPTVDMAQLAAHADGVIALSGCFASRLARQLVAGRTEQARRHADELLQIFGAEDVYFELQRHGIPGEEQVNAGVMGIARELRRPIVATADVHYLTADDHAAHAALRCAGDGGTLAAPRGAFAANDFYMRSTEEMERRFLDLPQAIAATLEVAERCAGGLELAAAGGHFPDYPCTGFASQTECLRHTVAAGLRARYGDPVPALAAARCEAELMVIERRGYSSYFMVVWDMVHFARAHGIAVGPGRGPAASSIVNYALRITELDPLAHDLLFERFLRHDGLVAPDIDIDFSVRGRAAVVRHLIDLYGSDRVAQISTFGRFLSRGATRAAARALGHDDAIGERLTRLIPDPRMGRMPSLASCLGPGEALHAECARDPKARAIVELAQGLEGVTREQSVHPCALVIGDRPLTEHLPLRHLHPNVDGLASSKPATQYSMRGVERLGLLKFDLLGLKNLDDIEDALSRIEALSGARPDLTALRLDDLETLAVFARGATSDVFQFSTQRARQTLARIRPDCFEDLAAAITLDRPNAQHLIAEYATAKRDPGAIKYLDERLRPILESTHGLLLYQEQQIQIAITIAGFTASKADDLRRALGKNHRDKIAALKVDFVDGARQSRTTEAVIEQIWDQIERSTDPAFNRSHALSYALIAYWSAWLKAHHPREYPDATQEAHKQGGAP